MFINKKTSVCISFNHATIILEPTMNTNMVFSFATTTAR